MSESDESILEAVLAVPWPGAIVAQAAGMLASRGNVAVAVGHARLARAAARRGTAPERVAADVVDLRTREETLSQLAVLVADSHPAAPVRPVIPAPRAGSY